MPPRVTAGAVVDALIRWRHAPPRWAAFPELCVGDGPQAWAANRRFDLWAIDTFPSGHYARVGYEVKVSRSDWKAELAKPAKRTLCLLASNLMYVAAPPGIVRDGELPLELGLVEVTPHAGGGLWCNEVVRAPWREPLEPTLRLLSVVARRSAEPLEERRAQLAAAVAHLESEQARLERRIAMLHEQYHTAAAAHPAAAARPSFPDR